MSAIFYENKVQKGTVKAVFENLDSLVDAIDQLKKAGLTHDMIVTSPLPRHDIEHVIYEGHAPSPIRWFTLAGALFGGTFGFSLQSITHLNWAMIIPGGKPLVSIPAFIVITFESTVLWGCLFTLVGMLLMTRLPANDLQIEVEDPRFSDDKFGLILNSLKRSQAQKAIEILQLNDAMETFSGFEQSDNKPPVVKVELPAKLIEPDDMDQNAGLLLKITLGLTLFVVFSIIGVRYAFDSFLEDELKSKNFNYSQSAVAPSYRTVDE
jgi:molybdopterin-containing oxidoreductase family membrane subunit